MWRRGVACAWPAEAATAARPPPHAAAAPPTSRMTRPLLPLLPLPPVPPLPLSAGLSVRGALLPQRRWRGASAALWLWRDTATAAAPTSAARQLSHGSRSRGDRKAARSTPTATDSQSVVRSSWWAGGRNEAPARALVRIIYVSCTYHIRTCVRLYVSTCMCGGVPVLISGSLEACPPTRRRPSANDMMSKCAVGSC